MFHNVWGVRRNDGNGSTSSGGPSSASLPAPGRALIRREISYAPFPAAGDDILRYECEECGGGGGIFGKGAFHE